MIGVIRVITSDDPEFVNTHGRWIEQRYGLATISRCIPDQPDGVHDEETFARAVPKIVTLAEELAADGADCIVISCAADPGLPEARAAVEVPVIGAASAGAATALALGGKAGVLGLNDEAPDAVRAVLGDRLVAATRPEGVRTTNDLLEPGALDRTVAAARRLTEAGAEVILFACTGLTTIGAAAPITKELGVTCVDAVTAAGLMASYATHRNEKGSTA